MKITFLHTLCFPVKCSKQDAEVITENKKRQVLLHETPSEVTWGVLFVEVLRNSIAPAECYIRLVITITLEGALC